MLYTRPTNYQENKVHSISPTSLLLWLWTFFPKFDNPIFFYTCAVVLIPVTAIYGGSTGKLLGS